MTDKFTHCSVDSVEYQHPREQHNHRSNRSRVPTLPFVSRHRLPSFLPSFPVAERYTSSTPCRRSVTATVLGQQTTTEMCLRGTQLLASLYIQRVFSDIGEIGITLHESVHTQACIVRGSVRDSTPAWKRQLGAWIANTPVVVGIWPPWNGSASHTTVNCRYTTLQFYGIIHYRWTQSLKHTASPGPAAMTCRTGIPSGELLAGCVTQQFPARYALIKTSRIHDSAFSSPLQWRSTVACFAYPASIRLRSTHSMTAFC